MSNSPSSRRGAKIKHGQAGPKNRSRVYTSWACMIQRCTNPNNQDFALYGGRGITFCAEWSKFEGFFADMGECSVGMELDRIDNNLGYTKANCRWVTQKVSARNRRNTRRFEFRGHFKTAGEWAEMFGLPRRVVTIRLRHGWSLERAFTTPLTIPPQRATRYATPARPG